MISPFFFRPREKGARDGVDEAESPLIRCAAQSAEILLVGIPHTFSVYDSKNVSKSLRPKRLTTQSSKLRSGRMGINWALK